MILEPPKIKSDTVSTVSPPISHEVMGPDAMIFVFWMLSFKPTFSLSSFTFITFIKYLGEVISGGVLIQYDLMPLPKGEVWETQVQFLGQEDP